MKAQKKLAVIILNYNDPDNTIRYVGEIEKYKLIDKIIVVDNKSPDGSFKKLQKLNSDKVDVIESEDNKGYAYGNNYAIKYLNDKYGEYKYIAISNPDVNVPEVSFNQCIEFLNQHKNVAICAPRMYDINDNPHELSGWKERSLKGDLIDSSLSLTALYKKSHIEKYDEEYLNKDIAYVDCVAGSFFIIKNSFFKDVGYFDEKTFLYFEEDILCNKLKQKGYKCVILNTCKFNHFESVSVDNTYNSNQKYKLLQKSKRYYHKTYNPKCNKWYDFWKIMILDFITFIKPIDDKLKFHVIVSKIKNIFDQGFVIIFIKLLIFLYTIITWPIYKIIKASRRKKKVLYFSLVTWKWIKQRPHFVALNLAKSGLYKVDYRYQTLFDKYMPKDSNLVDNSVDDIDSLSIKPFRIFPATNKFRFRLNTLISIIRSSFWNYDTIILTHPNQIHFLFMKVQKMRGVRFIYEAMDNYIGWEKDKNAYLSTEKRLVDCSSHLIVSSEKLRNRMIDLYNLSDNKCTLVRNGYDLNTFKNYKEVETGFQHPCITYIGTIDDWFDFDSIFNYAKNNKNVYFNIIGPINESVKKIIKKNSLKNVNFPGPIEHSMVPQYIKDSDIMIMPFKINEIIEYVDPVKVYEYLYMDKIVVSSYWKELDQFKNLIFFYEEGNFNDIINKALTTKYKESNEHKKLLNESTWDNRMKNYLKVVKKGLLYK